MTRAFSQSTLASELGVEGADEGGRVDVGVVLRGPPVRLVEYRGRPYW